MKKKIILIAIMVVALIFALSASAFAAYEQDRETVTYKGQAVSVVRFDVEISTVNNEIKADTSRGHTCSLGALTAMADDDSLCILKDSAGNLTAYPSWYIIDATGSGEGHAEIYEISYGYLNSISSETGKSYSDGAILYMEFPQGMSGVRNNGVFGMKTNGTPYETNVTDFYIPSSVTYITENAFNKMPKLENVFIEAGNTISKIGSGTFSNSTVKYVQFENLTEITSIDGFTACGITGDIDLSKCTKLKTISAGCFMNSKNVNKITLPNSVETIANEAFEYMGSAYLASPYLPTSLKSVGSRFFAYNDNLLDTYIFPEGVTALGSEPFQDSKVAGGPSGKELNLVFLGEVTGVVYLNGNGHQKHAEKVTVYFANNSLSDYNTNGFYIKPSGSSVTSVPGAIRVAFCEGTGAGTNGSVTGVEYIYITSTTGSTFTADMVNDATNGFDYDKHTHYGAVNVTAPTCGKNGFEGKLCIVCDNEIGTVLPATGLHTYDDDHNCTTAEVCTVCSQEVNIPNAEHQIKLVITYDNGYMQAGVRVASCENDGCEFCETTNPKALFTFLGYSKNQAGTQACVGYQIAYEEIAEFKSANQLESFEYGVVAGVKSLVPNAQPLVISENKVQAVKLEKGNVVKVDLDTKSALYQVDFRLVGFEGNEDLEVLMCAYVYDGTELSYLQNAQTSIVSAVTINTISEEE